MTMTVEELVAQWQEEAEDDGLCHCDDPLIDSEDENSCWRCGRDIEDDG